MSMCRGKAQGQKGECLQPVPAGVLTQLCDRHLLLASKDLEERGGTKAAVERIRAAGK